MNATIRTTYWPLSDLFKFIGNPFRVTPKEKSAKIVFVRRFIGMKSRCGEQYLFTHYSSFEVHKPDDAHNANINS